MNAIAYVFLKKNEEKEIEQGFPWVFDNEIDFIKTEYKEPDGKHNVLRKPLEQSDIEDGSPVAVFSKSGLYLGMGIINKKSKITIRFLSYEKYPLELDADSFCSQYFNEEFFVTKIKNALSLRFSFYKKEDSYRLIFGEADFIPGLVVERYVDTEQRVFLVIQFLSLSCDRFRTEIVHALIETMHPYGIYERSDANVREKEGLTLQSGWITEVNGYNLNLPISKDENLFDSAKIVIKENDVLLSVDIANGQKTGYFLDQKFNRKKIQALCKDKNVLDTFSHTGAFGLNAVLGGAKSVLAVDISQEACDNINQNIKLNNCEKVMSSMCSDVFDVLKFFVNEKKQFDLIILDPPAFAKSAKSIDKAYGGYKEINMSAMKLLPKGGLLVTCSCSNFFDEQKFYDMLMHAALDVHKKIQILEKSGAGPDHPILSGYPKSEYLKCAIVRVL